MEQIAEQWLEEKYEELPDNVQAVLLKYDNNVQSIEQCRWLESELNKLGYGIEWYLDLEPFNLHKL